MSLKSEHGGQLALIKRQFSDVEKWLDLSTGIAPWSYPCGNFDEHDLRSLPDEDLFTNTQRAAARHYGVKDSMILAGSGAQSFIRLLPQIAQEIFGKDIVFYTRQPTYNEYAIAAESFGFPTFSFNAGSDFTGSAVIVLGNPNNPDGHKVNSGEAIELSQKLGKNGLLVIDEAFCDIEHETSLVSLCEEHENIIILKSFGKFFGLAGLRLGFAIGSESILGLFMRALGVWSVSSASLLIGEQAYRDKVWIESQRLKITETAAKLQLLLRKKTEIVCNAGLFISCRSRLDLFTIFASRGIYIRSFTRDKDLYRLGLPFSESDFTKLEGVLDSL